MSDAATLSAGTDQAGANSPGTARAKILAVTSGKGGVVKTFVAANLAVALVRRGRKVLLLDADLGLANLDIVLNLRTTGTLHDVLTGSATIDDVVVQAPCGIAVLPAASGLIEYSRLTGDVQDELRAVIADLGRRYDYVLLDTGAGGPRGQQQGGRRDECGARGQQCAARDAVLGQVFHGLPCGAACAGLGPLGFSRKPRRSSAMASST